MDRVEVVNAPSERSGEPAPHSSPDTAAESGIWTVFVSPSRALLGLRSSRPWFWPLLIAGAALALSQTWLIQKVGMQQVVVAAVRNSGSLDTAGTIRNLSSNSAAVLTGQAFAAVLGCFIAAMVIACVLWLSSAVVGEQGRFRSILAVVALAVFTYSVTRAGMLLATIGLAAHPERLSIKDPLATSLGYFLHPKASGWMALFGSLDVLSIGAVVLLIQGLRIVAGLSWRRAVLTVAIPWIAYLSRGFITSVI